MSSDKKKLEEVAKYLSEKRILIADPSSAARASIAKVLKDLGAKTSHMTLVPHFEAAVHEIAQSAPQIVFSDYHLDEKCGLKLLPFLRRKYPDAQDYLFVLVTANSVESVIAEAAEEDVDGYVLKPFTLEVLRAQIIKAAYSKVDPSIYKKTIDSGKVHLLAKRADPAKAAFSQAITMSQKPSLAHYYYGQACLIHNEYKPAETSYLDGLKYNEFHYRCLTGLLDVFLSQERLNEAYEVANKITLYFPVSPQRLDEILRLLVKTQTFSDIDFYYSVFINLDYRTQELNRVMTAALVVAGMYYLNRRRISASTDLFRKALVTAGRAPFVLREIITALVHMEYFHEAESFLKEFQVEFQNEPTFQVMEYLVGAGGANAAMAIDRGRKLLEKGVHDPVVYEVLIRHSARAGLRESAESLAHEASKKFPESKAKFESLLNANQG